MNDWLSKPRVPGWRDTTEPVALPDVTITGDEFLHILAIQGETISGNPTAHPMSRVPFGFPSPDCSCCRSIMDKSHAFQEMCERIGAADAGGAR